jgi:acyl-CoA reductase-like NAD-dependent aldehyde dehydrogenase
MRDSVLPASKFNREVVVYSPYDGEVVGTVRETDPSEVVQVLERAKRGARHCRSLPRHKRASILEKAAQIILSSHEDFARLITKEAGKTIIQARKETSRCINTMFTREPLGIIAAITPYNDPLNLVAHKLGPAIAGGNAIILKPSELAPLSALRLVDALLQAGLPEEIVTVAVGGPELGRAIIALREVRMISFTGGFATGEAIAKGAGLKKLAMDLGGNAPVIVMADCDFNLALESTVSGAYWAAGQNCIGAQRILVQAEIYSRFRDAFVEATRALIVGDPSSEKTDVGPMISERSIDRIQQIVESAITSGAKLLYGHKRDGALYHPTVLEDVPRQCTLWSDEVFAPVVMLRSFNSLADAIDLANDPDYMLHAGIFTCSLEDALCAADQIDAGGIMINDSSDFRFDAMPFGGFKYGSMGREGVRFAYEDMTQPKVVCINRG